MPLDPAPDFGDAAPRPAPGGRLLLISFHFPPNTSAGALRWQKLARLAAGRGMALDVVTCDPAELPVADTARLADLPEGTRVFGVRAQPIALARLEALLRRAYRRARPRAARHGPPGAQALEAVPSRAPSELVRAYNAWLAHAREADWAARAEALARRVLDPALHRAVVTCGPPHGAHVAGRRLARGSALPLVLDLRDPWSLVERIPDDLSRRVWLRLAAPEERRALAAAALVVMNTPLARDAMRARYPAHAERILCVMNGCDDETLPPPRRGARFVIAYLGTIYLDRDPTLLFRAAASVARELGLGPADLSVEFMGEAGHVRGVPTEAIAEREGIGPFFRRHPPAPRAAAMEFLAGASLLVNLHQDSRMAIPSKIFEYVRFPAWVLALAEPGSASELALRGTSALVVPPGDAPAIAAALRRCVVDFRAGKRPEPVADGSALSREAQAAILFDALEAAAPWPRR